jgi:hypothetical protein
MTESIRNLDVIPPAEDDEYYGDEDMIIRKSACSLADRCQRD